MVISVSSRGKDAKILTDDKNDRDSLHLVVRIDGDAARVTTLVLHLLHEPCLGVDLDSTAPVSRISIRRESNHPKKPSRSGNDDFFVHVPPLIIVIVQEEAVDIAALAALATPRVCPGLERLVVRQGLTQRLACLRKC